MAMVSVLETSLPPGRSVIHWPDVQALDGSREVRRSYADWSTFRVDASRGLDERWVARRRAAPSVMADGHVTYAYDPVQRWYLANW